MIRAPHSAAQGFQAVMCAKNAKPASYTLLNRHLGMFGPWAVLSSGKDSHHA